MNARFKLVGLIFCLVLFLVPTFHFQAIPAEGDKVADAKEKLKFNEKSGKLEKKNEQTKNLKIQKATINLDQNNQKEEGKKSAESTQEKGPERGRMRGNRLDGNEKDNFRSISTESGEEYYKVIVDNNLFRPLGWRPPNNKPRYTLIGTWISSNGVTAKALILEQRSNQTYYVSIGEKVGEATVEGIKSNQVSLDLSGDIKMIKSESMQFLSDGEKERKREGKGEKSKSEGETREDGEQKRDKKNSRGRNGKGDDAGSSKGSVQAEAKGWIDWAGNASDEERRAEFDSEKFRNLSPEVQKAIKEGIDKAADAKEKLEFNKR